MDPEDDVLENDDTGAAAPQTRSPVNADPAEQDRVRTITSLARSAGLPQETIDRAITARTTVEAFRTTAFEAMTARPDNRPIVPGNSTGLGMNGGSRIGVGRDEGDTRMRGMSLELMRRMAREEKPRSGEARQYHGLSIVEMAAEAIGYRGRIYSTADREKVLQRAFHATSDFPLMFAQAGNGRLEERYTAETVTYRALCRRRDVADFRPDPYFRPGDLPVLKKVVEGGEITYGTFSESREQLVIASYARAIGFSRQLLINDDLGAIDDVLGSYAERVTAFEESLFWALVLANSGAGPTLQTTTRPLFNATDKNLGTAADINEFSMSQAWQLMRSYKSLDGLFVRAEPKYLVVSPKRELMADKLLAAVAATESANVNPYAGKMIKLVAPELGEVSGTEPWYVFADPAKVPAFVYSLLEGYTAPRLSFHEPFDTQGLKAKVEHDVGFSGIDFRGAVKNPGN